MGRLLLLILASGATAAFGSCTPAPDDTRPPAGGVPSEAHADLTCVRCHRGEVTERSQPAVPAQSCAASECHSDGGPTDVVFSTVEFRHRRHGTDSLQVAMTCVGCHSHDRGDAPISAGTDACALCHASELSGEDGGDCQVCHTDPGHRGFTSQGVAVAHEGLPWIRGECVRCHYDVAEPPRHVGTRVCATCHADREEITVAGIGVDLHPSHTSVACTACHTSGGHRIVAMSSAVDLTCSHCHVRAHDLEVETEGPRVATCNACHGETHRAQQRLVLGAVPHLDAVPSEKFLDGLTCRSCHVPLGPERTVRVGGSASCTGCHRAEFATVLAWWREGTAQRQRAVERYLERAEGTLGRTSQPDSTARLLQEARDLLEVVLEAGGEHNLPLAHRVFDGTVDRTVRAYRASGRSVPTPPDLGRRPRMGICSYCHYRLDDALALRSLSEAEVRFHREVLGVVELVRGGGR